MAMSERKTELIDKNVARLAEIYFLKQLSHEKSANIRVLTIHRLPNMIE